MCHHSLPLPPHLFCTFSHRSSHMVVTTPNHTLPCSKCHSGSGPRPPWPFFSSLSAAMVWSPAVRKSPFTLPIHHRVTRAHHPSIINRYSRRLMRSRSNHRIGLLYSRCRRGYGDSRRRLQWSPMVLESPGATAPCPATWWALSTWRDPRLPDMVT